MNDGKTVLFSERQPFGAWSRAPLAFGLAFAAVGSGYGLWRQLVLGKPFGHHPLDDGPLVAVVVLTLSILASTLAVFRRARLEIEVRDDGIHARFYPLHRRVRHFRIEEIVSCRAVRVRPVLEYGGYGIRWSLFRGRAWIAGGNGGVQLEFNDRPRLLIGSQRPEEFAAAVEEARKRVRPGRWS